MVNVFAWPIIRLVQRLSMVLTLGCCAYVIFFLLFQGNSNSVPDSSFVPAQVMSLASTSSAFNVKPYDASADFQGRDIFSLAAVNPSGAAEITPKGQLPDHLKVVGILISHPSQIIIVDSIVNKTYFIEDGKPQAGISIVKAGKGQMIINYQGQDIDIPITKN